jgi:hypothetical protein
VPFADDLLEIVFYFDGDFLCEPIFDVLNFELWLRFDFTVVPWFDPFMLTVRPKSGMSKFLSYNWANSKFVNRLSIFGFSYPFLYTL